LNYLFDEQNIYIDLCLFFNYQRNKRRILLIPWLLSCLKYLYSSSEVNAVLFPRWNNINLCKEDFIISIVLFFVMKNNNYYCPDMLESMLCYSFVLKQYLLLYLFICFVRFCWTIFRYLLIYYWYLSLNNTRSSWWRTIGYLSFVVVNKNYYDLSLLFFLFGKKSLLFRGRYLYLSVDLSFNSVKRYLTLRSIWSNDIFIMVVWSNDNFSKFRGFAWILRK